MIHALIIEDENPIAQALKQNLEALHVQVLQILPSVESARKYFMNPPKLDLIFADIHIGDGLSFEIFKNQTSPAPIIFTTAYDTYTLQAFKLNSIDYLLKPITLEKLKQTLQKYENLKQTFQPDYSALFQQFVTGKNYRNHFLVKVGNFYQPLQSTEICAVYSENKITYLQTDRTFVWDDSLNELEGQLNPEIFFRINRQMLINRNAILEIKNFLNSRLQLRIKNISEPIVVSRERVNDFKKWLQT